MGSESGPWWQTLLSDLPTLEKMISEGKSPLDVDDRGHTLLHVAATLHDADLVNFSSKHVPIEARNNIGMTALHLASAGDCVESIVALIGAKADLNAQSSQSIRTRLVVIATEGQTPLHFALGRVPPAEAAAKVLIENGADVTIKDSNGRVPGQK